MNTASRLTMITLLNKHECRRGTATISKQRLDLFDQVGALEMVAVPGLATTQAVEARVQAPVSGARWCCRHQAIGGNGSQSPGGFLPRIAVNGGLRLAMALLFICGTAFAADVPAGTEPSAPPAAASAAAPAVTPTAPAAAPADEPAATASLPVEVAPVAVSQEPAAPATAPSVSAPPAEKQQDGPATNDQLQAEVCALREDMRMLQSTLDLMVNRIMADLREENEQLRDEIRRLNTLRGMQGAADINAVPRPAGAAVDQALSEAPTTPALPPPPPFKFTVIREWGRTAEEARQLGGEAQSLKGLIGVVPKGSLRGDVEKLARDLRGKYDAYDNINIEVFDDPMIANEFAANRTADPQRRVLSVSRHKSSNRDAIVLLANGKGRMISLDPNEAPPPQQPDDVPTLSVTNPVSPGQSKRPKAADAPAEAVAPASPDEKAGPVPGGQAAPVPEEQAAPGKWQKSDKKNAHVKGSSKKRKGEQKDETILPVNQRQLPEGMPLLVPHEPAPPVSTGKATEGSQAPTPESPAPLVPHESRQPETTVIVAPPGEPVEALPAPEVKDEAAAPETDGDAGKVADQEASAKAQQNPKKSFGRKSKKGK